MPYADKAKQKKYQHEHYLANRPLYYDRSESRTNLCRQIVQEIKERNPCSDCGESYPYFVMEFDHVRGVKRQSISKLIKIGGLRAVLREIQKCDLVCSNCHAFRTRLRQVQSGSVANGRQSASKAEDVGSSPAALVEEKEGIPMAM